MMYGIPVTCHVSTYDNSSYNKASMGSLISKVSYPILYADSLYVEQVCTEGPTFETHLEHSRRTIFQAS